MSQSLQSSNQSHVQFYMTTDTRAASGAFLAQAVYSDAGGKIGAIVLQISAQEFEEALKKLDSMKNSATAFILD